ncbi:MAG: sigma-70 family RNA polymerase sigma factor [Bacilli bacterium]|nr:sigma-70 family RNA polymerase sigma factor [Bacilli bacterium]
MIELPTKALTREENLSLLERLRNEHENYDEIRSQLIEGNMRLVFYQVFQNFKNVCEDKEDLISIGTIGLMKAIDNFDFNRTKYFSSFATRCINNEILMHVRKLKRIHSVDFESFDEVVSSNNTLTLSEILPSNVDIEYDFQLKEDKKMVWEYLETISEKQQVIMKYYFGFIDGKPYNQYEIADILHLTQSYISRVVNKHLKMIPIFLEEHKVSSKEKEKGSKISFLYDYFPNYSKDDVNDAILKLNKKDLKFLSSWIQSDDKTTFPYQNLILKLKKILNQKEEVIKQEIKIPKKKEEVESTSIISNKKDEDSLNEIIETPKSKDISYSFHEDLFLKDATLYFLNHSSYVTPKEYFLLMMKYSTAFKHSYSTLELSKFLNISEEEINSILIQSLKNMKEFYSSEVQKILKK